MSNQLNVGALPYEPTSQKITKPPSAVEMLVSSQAQVTYHQLPNYPYRQFFHYSRQEAELAHFYSYYYYYYNIKSQPQPEPHFYSVYFQPTESPSPYADFLGGGEKKQLVGSYISLEAKKNNDDGGFTKFASSGKRWKVFGCRGKKGCGTQWRPRSSKSAAAGGGGQNWGSGKTTVMIKNIPNQMRRKLLIEFIDKLCDEDSHLAYDFLYLPMDFVRKNNYGYAFVNFTSTFAAKKIKEVLNGYKWGCIQTDSGSFLSHKVCEMTLAKIQGREALVRHFQNTTFRCESTDWLPVVFCPPRNGSNSTSEQRNVGNCNARSS
ncbi:hypothetical protein LguiA_018132 [Lonicera macranthoides]